VPSRQDRESVEDQLAAAQTGAPIGEPPPEQGVTPEQAAAAVGVVTAAGAAAGAGTTVAGAQTAAGATTIASVPASAVLTAEAGAVVGAAAAALRALRPGGASGDEIFWLFMALKSEADQGAFGVGRVSDGDLLAASEREREYERTFWKRVGQRLIRDLPGALQADDPRGAVQKILDRERRWVIAHHEAALGRARADLKRRMVEVASPEGAYWVLRAGLKHCPTCLAMAAVGWWPWPVLKVVHPPVHPNCGCDLLTHAEAQARGLMGPEVPSAEALKNRAKMMGLMESNAGLCHHEGHPMTCPGHEDDGPVMELEEADHADGIMVALYPDPELAVELSLNKGEEPKQLHLTLAYLGNVSEHGNDPSAVLDAVRKWAENCPPLQGEISGYGKFVGGDEPVTYASVDLPDLPEQRQALVDALGRTPCPAKEDHGYTPHITLDYASRRPKIEKPIPVSFGEVHVVWGLEDYSLPLGDPANPASLEEAPWDRRFAKGTIWGGRFMPKRGGFSPRVSLRDIMWSAFGAKAPDVAERGSERRYVGQRSPATLPVGTPMGTPTKPRSPQAQSAMELAERVRARATDTAKDRKVGLKLGKVKFDPLGDDSAGLRQWNGDITFGPDPALVIEGAAATSGTLPDTQAALLYHAYRVINHEMIHGVNPQEAHEYFGAQRALEEALVEELAHISARRDLKSEGRWDVMRWLERNPDDLRARGMYQPQRAGLRAILDEAAVPLAERESLIETLKYSVPSAQREAVLGGLLARAQGIDPEAARERVTAIMTRVDTAPLTSNLGVSILAEPSEADHRMRLHAGATVKVGDRYTGVITNAGWVADDEWSIEVEVEKPDGRKVYRYPSPEEVEVLSRVPREQLTGRGVVGDVHEEDKVRVTDRSGASLSGTLIAVKPGPSGHWTAELDTGTERYVMTSESVAAVAQQTPGQGAVPDPDFEPPETPREAFRRGAIERAAGAMHADWQTTVPEGGPQYRETRTKLTTDEDYAAANAGPEVDVANTPYGNLPPDLKAPLREKAAEAIDAITDMQAEVQTLDVEALADEVQRRREDDDREFDDLTAPEQNARRTEVRTAIQALGMRVPDPMPEYEPLEEPNKGFSFDASRYQDPRRSLIQKLTAMKLGQALNMADGSVVTRGADGNSFLMLRPDGSRRRYATSNRLANAEIQGVAERHGVPERVKLNRTDDDVAITNMTVAEIQALHSAQASPGDMTRQQIASMTEDDYRALTSPPIPDPFDPQNPEHEAEFAEARAARHRWDSAILTAISMGELDPVTAREARGFYGTPTDSWKPLPERTYHVTTASDAIMATGLKTRKELNLKSGKGLGAGTDEWVSLTDLPEMAEGIAAGMIEAGKVARGERTVHEMMAEAQSGEGADRPWIENIARYWDYRWKAGDPLPDDLQRMLDDEKGLADGTLDPDEWVESRTTGSGINYVWPGWEGVPGTETGQEAGTTGTPGYEMMRRTRAMKMADDRVDFAKKFWAFRSHANGPMDPLFMAVATEDLAQITPENTKIVEVERVSDKIRGTFHGGLSEWRVPSGEAIRPVKVRDPEGTPLGGKDIDKLVGEHWNEVVAGQYSPGLQPLEPTGEPVLDAAGGHFVSGPIRDLLIRKGRGYKRDDSKIDEKYADLPNAPNVCYRNATVAVQRHPELTYVEGYAMPPGVPFPIAHGWTVDPDGNVIDPTWKDGEHYYGIPFKTEELMAILLHTKEYGVLTTVWTDPWVAERLDYDRKASEGQASPGLAVEDRIQEWWGDREWGKTQAVPGEPVATAVELYMADPAPFHDGSETIWEPNWDREFDGDEMREALNEAFRPLPFPVTVYRGGEFRDGQQIISTSTRAAQAAKFGSGPVWRYEVPAGTPAIWITGRGEKELLLRPEGPLAPAGTADSDGQASPSDAGFTTWTDVERRYGELVPTEALLPYLEFDRDITDDDSLDLTDSLARDGEVKSAVVLDYDVGTKRMYVADGNHRVKIASLLGIKTIPVVGGVTTIPPHPSGAGGGEPPEGMKAEAPEDRYGYARPSDLGLPVVGRFTPSGDQPERVMASNFAPAPVGQHSPAFVRPSDLGLPVVGRFAPGNQDRSPLAPAPVGQHSPFTEEAEQSAENRRILRDAVLDLPTGQASPAIAAEPDYDNRLSLTLIGWLGDPGMMLRHADPKDVEILTHEIEQGDPGFGPFFRGQRVTDPEPTESDRPRGWSRDLTTAVKAAATYVVSPDGAVTNDVKKMVPLAPGERQVLVLYATQEAGGGLDVGARLEELGMTNPFAHEQEVILDPDNLDGYRRVEIEINRADADSGAKPKSVDAILQAVADGVRETGVEGQFSPSLPPPDGYPSDPDDGYGHSKVGNILWDGVRHPVIDDPMQMIGGFPEELKYTPAWHYYKKGGQTLDEIGKELLGHGGKRVVFQPGDPAHLQVSQSGYFRDGAGAELREGRGSACHNNASELWKMGVGSIVTGFALSDDGIWRPHSWIEKPDGQIVETTVMRDAYYGAKVDNYFAQFFVEDNPPLGAYDGQASPGVEDFTPFAVDYPDFGQRAVRFAEVEGLKTDTRVIAAWLWGGNAPVTPLGAVTIDRDNGNVELVAVDETVRRQGLAAKLVEVARDHTGLPLDRASEMRSEAGVALADTVGMAFPDDAAPLGAGVGEEWWGRLANDLSRPVGVTNNWIGEWPDVAKTPEELGQASPAVEYLPPNYGAVGNNGNIMTADIGPEIPSTPLIYGVVAAKVGGQPAGSLTYTYTNPHFADGFRDGTLTQDEKNKLAWENSQWKWEDGRVVRLQVAAVVPEHQRKGIATELLRQVRDMFPREDGWTIEMTGATRDGRALVDATGVSMIDRINPRLEASSDDNLTRTIVEQNVAQAQQGREGQASPSTGALIAPPENRPPLVDELETSDQLSVLFGDDPAGALADDLDRTISPDEIEAAKRYVYGHTQASLRHRGLPFRFTVYRAGEAHSGPTNYSLTRVKHWDDRGGQTPHWVLREDVLVDSNAFFPNGYVLEDEVVARNGQASPALPPVDRAPATVGDLTFAHDEVDLKGTPATASLTANGPDGVQRGLIYYAEWPSPRYNSEQPTVTMLYASVREPYRRQGVMTALVKDLRRRHPREDGWEIDTTEVTPDGGTIFPYMPEIDFVLDSPLGDGYRATQPVSQATKDAALDEMGQASPAYTPGEDHDSWLDDGLIDWQVFQSGSPLTRNEAFKWEIDNGEIDPGPLFRGESSDPSTKPLLKARAWSHDPAVAAYHSGLRVLQQTEGGKWVAKRRTTDAGPDDQLGVVLWMVMEPEHGFDINRHRPENTYRWESEVLTKARPSNKVATLTLPVGTPGEPVTKAMLYDTVDEAVRERGLYDGPPLEDPLERARRAEAVGQASPSDPVTGTLTDAARVYVAEGALKRGGLTGRDHYVPVGKMPDPDGKGEIALGTYGPKPQELSDWASEIAGSPVKVISTTWWPEGEGETADGGDTLASADHFMQQINVTPETDDLTLLHELAHLMVGPDAGHGDEWINKAAELYGEHISPEARRNFLALVRPGQASPVNYPTARKVYGEFSPEIGEAAADWEDKMTAKDRRIMDNYIWAMYGQLDREGAWPVIDAMTRRGTLPTAQTLYRGALMSRAGGTDDKIWTLTPGDEWDSGSLVVSMSLDEHTARVGHGEGAPVDSDVLVLELDVPEGQQAAFPSGNSDAIFNSEMEVLLPAGTRMVVTDVTEEPRTEVGYEGASVPKGIVRRVKATALPGQASPGEPTGGVLFRPEDSVPDAAEDNEYRRNFAEFAEALPGQSSPSITTHDEHVAKVRAKHRNAKARADKAHPLDLFYSDVRGIVDKDEADHIARLVEDARLTVRMEPETLTLLLKGTTLNGGVKSRRRGKWRREMWDNMDSQKRRGKRNDPYLKERRETEARLFGDNPVYGYFTNGYDLIHDTYTNQYGGVAVFLKDGVKDRTSYTLGDSLDDDDEVVPTPVGESSVLATKILGEYAHDARTFPTLDGFLTDTGYNAKDGKDVHSTRVRYAEAQIFGGGVSLDDVEAVVFTTDANNDWGIRRKGEPITYGPTDEQKEMLDKAGVPWATIGLDGEVVEKGKAPVREFWRHLPIKRYGGFHDDQYPVSPPQLLDPPDPPESYDPTRRRPEKSPGVRDYNRAIASGIGFYGKDRRPKVGMIVNLPRANYADARIVGVDTENHNLTVERLDTGEQASIPSYEHIDYYTPSGWERIEALRAANAGQASPATRPPEPDPVLAQMIGPSAGQASPSLDSRLRDAPVVAETIEGLDRDYPDVLRKGVAKNPDKFGAFGAVTPPGGYALKGLSVEHDDGRTLLLGDFFFSDEKVEEARQHLSRGPGKVPGWAGDLSTVDSTRQTIIIHEFGHILWNALEQQYPEARDNVLKHFLADVTYDNPDPEGPKKLWKARWQRFRKPSLYASTNFNEYVAESFVDYRMNGDEAMNSSIGIGRLFDKSFGPDADHRSVSDEALDKVAGQASPSYKPGPDHEQAVFKAASKWVSDPDKALGGKFADALMHEVRNGPPQHGPLYRTQDYMDPEPDTLPDRPRGWTRSLLTAVQRATASIIGPNGETLQRYSTPGADTLPGERQVMTIYVADSASNGLDVTATVEKAGIAPNPFAFEREVVALPDRLKNMRRIEVEVSGPQNRDPFQIERTAREAIGPDSALDRAMKGQQSPSDPDFNIFFGKEPPPRGPATEQAKARAEAEMPSAPVTGIPKYKVDLTFDKPAGGSNGAKFMKDPDGNGWIIKHYSGDEERVATELLANAVYRELGIAAPNAGIIMNEGELDFAAIPDADIDEPPLPKSKVPHGLQWQKEKRISTGIIMMEPDGRIWIYEPLNHFGGYEHTFSKGGLEDGLTAQQNAHKELWEEMGLQAEVVGYLGDYEGDTSTSRFYLARRTGVPREPDGGETEAVKLVTPEEAAEMLNRSRDLHILADVVDKIEEGWPGEQPPITDTDPPRKPTKPAIGMPLVNAEERNWDDESEALGAGFVADALTANWDVVGLSQDNILWTDDDVPIRVDQGGTFEMRAQGSPKEYGPVPVELWTMNRPGGQAFGTMKVTEDDMRAQARGIELRLTPERIDELVDEAPFEDNEMRERIRENLKARVEWLGLFGAGEVGLPEPVEGKAATQMLRERDASLVLTDDEETGIAALLTTDRIDKWIEHRKSKKKKGTFGKPHKGKKVGEVNGKPIIVTPPPVDPVEKVVKALRSLMHAKATLTTEDVAGYIEVPDLKALGVSVPSQLEGRWFRDPSFVRLKTDSPEPGAIRLKVLVPAGSHVLIPTTEMLGVDALGPGEGTMILPDNVSIKITRVEDDGEGGLLLDAVVAGA
jgi:2'-5' RNA ligase/GNAT superfamily N-acetyltransferase/ADP-ribose pyrophosphatase YjhB (NUDIX family)